MEPTVPRGVTLDPGRPSLQLSTSPHPQVSGYSLLVQAADSGSPALSSTATVNIDISDVNDNGPVFTPANYSAVIQVRMHPPRRRASVPSGDSSKSTLSTAPSIPYPAHRGKGWRDQ